MGWPASSFCGSAASPPRRRLRRRCLAAAVSPTCRCFVRRRRQVGDGCIKVRWRRCGVAATWEGGVMVEDLATSMEVEWHRPRIRGGGCLGVFPGRWIFFVFKSSSSELVAPAALQRLLRRFRRWTRAPSAPWWMSSGGLVLRRLRRRGLCALEDPEGDDGVTQRRALFSPCFFFACICSCNAPF